MPIAYEYFEDANILELKVTGELKSREIVDYFQLLLDGDFLREGFIEIVDLNGVTDFVLRFTDLEKIQQLTGQFQKAGQKATLMCCYNQRARGVSAMMNPLYLSAKFTFLICETEADKDAFLESLS
ncbi:MAG: hypothetical protein AseanaTS_15170 [Candidatus Pelagadaptatus aseana]|uniref:hypothetical protein n=1 Tax=Candidatus Pelagadaptatus aseana TaxID=3120508 RepID=UPI0039B2B51F